MNELFSAGAAVKKGTGADIFLLFNDSIGGIFRITKGSRTHAENPTAGNGSRVFSKAAGKKQFKALEQQSRLVTELLFYSFKAAASRDEAQAFGKEVFDDPLDLFAKAYRNGIDC